MDKKPSLWLVRQSLVPQTAHRRHVHHWISRLMHALQPMAAAVEATRTGACGVCPLWRRPLLRKFKLNRAASRGRRPCLMRPRVPIVALHNQIPKSRRWCCPASPSSVHRQWCCHQRRLPRARRFPRYLHPQAAQRRLIRSKASTLIRRLRARHPSGPLVAHPADCGGWGLW